MEVPAEPGFVFGQGPTLSALNAIVADVARTDIPVLLIGESGTGKEAYARLIHRMWAGPGPGNTPEVHLNEVGERSWRKISCATHDAPRFLEELRAFLSQEQVDGKPCCLFLDNIEELDLACQRTLASLLPEDHPEHGSMPKLRLISSTSLNLEKAIEAGRFRRELYFRVNGASLRLPPLRERKEDIPALVDHFLARYSRSSKATPVLNSEAMEVLIAHQWPGNIRELENVVKKMVAFADTRVALNELRVSRTQHKPLETSAETRVSSLKVAARAASRRTERELILKALERTHWNRKRAAQELQISYKSLLYKIKQIDVPGPGSEE